MATLFYVGLGAAFLLLLVGLRKAVGFLERHIPGLTEWIESL